MHVRLVKAAQGLADYVKEFKPAGPWTLAVAYDTRHRSREFAELCASVMVANGFEVFFIDDYRSTPELSFLTRYKNCDCGIMVTASHNPPSDNAVKVYWSSGAQLIPPHDKAVIEKVGLVDEIPTVDFESAVKAGKIHLVREEIDDALRAEEIKHSFAGPRDLKIIFSPLHGVGEFNVKSLLQEDGFKDLEIYEPHREPSGDFPNVPGHVSNPENREVFDSIIEHAKATGAELILASDPDCDRMGAAAPVTRDPAGPWNTFNGNQLCVLLADFILRQRQLNGNLTPENYVVTTLVTTRMLNRICDSFNVRCLNENLVGFKWICDVVDREGPDQFVYGTEESHGFLVGQYCRDKDGAVACMLMSELAAWCKEQGKSLFDHLDDLYLGARISPRKIGQYPHGRLRRDEKNGCIDGEISQCPAEIPGRTCSCRGPRLLRRETDFRRRKVRANRWSNWKYLDFSDGKARQLCGSQTIGYRTEGQILHVHLCSNGRNAGPRRRQRPHGETHDRLRCGYASLRRQRLSSVGGFPRVRIVRNLAVFAGTSQNHGLTANHDRTGCGLTAFMPNDRLSGFLAGFLLAFFVFLFCIRCGFFGCLLLAAKSRTPVLGIFL